MRSSLCERSPVGHGICVLANVSSCARVGTSAGSVAKRTRQLHVLGAVAVHELPVVPEAVDELGLVDPA